MPKLLLLDHDPATRKELEAVVNEAGFEPVAAADLAAARRALSENVISIWIVESDLPDGRGSDLLEDLPEDSDVEVIFIAEDASLEGAVEALRGGAVDYLTKPVDPSRLRRVLRQLRKTYKLKHRVQDLSRELRSIGRFGQLVGSAPAMQEVYDLVERVAPTEATVFVTGETGTGKEVVARSVHTLSERSDKPFVPINCGAVPEALMESELFGHEKGAFTGAERQHQGMFERAHEGTLFLDEVTEMSLDLQVKLLRVLETHQVRRVGGSRLIDVDVRIVAATNRKPQEAITEGKLREDLLYRLSVFPIELPPLRVRAGDVRLLAQHFLGELNREHGEGKTLAESTLAVLETHAWPGNVRELQNTLERAFILAGLEITPDCIRFEGDGSATAGGGKADAAPAPSAAPGPEPGPDLLSLKEIERSHILHVLDVLEGNKKKAAKVLGISLKTLYNRLKKYSEEGSPGE